MHYTVQYIVYGIMHSTHLLPCHTKAKFPNLKTLWKATSLLHSVPSSKPRLIHQELLYNFTSETAKSTFRIICFGAESPLQNIFSISSGCSTCLKQPPNLFIISPQIPFDAFQWAVPPCQTGLTLCLSCHVKLSSSHRYFFGVTVTVSLVKRQQCYLELKMRNSCDVKLSLITVVCAVQTPHPLTDTHTQTHTHFISPPCSPTQTLEQV